MRIFISYRRKDSAREVGRIRDRLKAAFGEDSVFRDVVDIPAGVDFRTVLKRETQDCDVMLVIIGPLWVGITDGQGNKRLFDPGDFTRIEVEAGLNRLGEGKAMVIPVLVSNTNMPFGGDLPESLELLHYQNAISVRDDPDFDHDMDRLIRDIRRSKGYAQEEFRVDYFEPETLRILEGPFWMGSAEASGAPAYEGPQHEVHLPVYRVGKYPVTNAQYEEFVRETQRLVTPVMGWDGQRVPAGQEKHPVTGVTWYEALAYSQWLVRKTGRKYSLPNEAQWEKACRGGNTFLYPWGDELDPKRSNHGCEALSPVDAYPAQNEFGLYDLVGNVRQWTCSLWGERRLAPEPSYAYPWKNDRRNDTNANSQIRRILRGSAVKDAILFLRCSARGGHVPEDPGLPGMRHGFRIVINE